MQRSRRRELRQRTQPPMRQPRRARRERVEMKHDERTRKADTEEVCAAISATASQSTAVLPGSPFTTRQASAEDRARVEISPMWRKIPRPAFSKPIVADEPRSTRKDHRRASTTTCWTTDEALLDMACEVFEKRLRLGGIVRLQIVGPAVADRLESQLDFDLVRALAFRQRHLIAHAIAAVRKVRIVGRTAVHRDLRLRLALSKPRGSSRLSLR